MKIYKFQLSNIYKGRLKPLCAWVGPEFLQQHLGCIYNISQLGRPQAVMDEFTTAKTLDMKIYKIPTISCLMGRPNIKN